MSACTLAVHGSNPGNTTGSSGGSSGGSTGVDETGASSGTSSSGGSSGTSSSGGSSGTSSGGTGASQLLHVSANHHYFVDAGDQPFYLVGDTAWCLVTRLTPSQANTYFQTRASQGFNAVLIDSDVADVSSPLGAPACGPNDADGNPPFNATLPEGDFDVSSVPAAGDTTSAATKYWANIDAIVMAAAQNGIQVIFDVYDNYSPWFGHADSPNSPAKLSVYGQFLGQRYANFDNIIWMIGNDYSSNADAEGDFVAVMQGIRQFDTRHLGWALDQVGAGFDNVDLRPDFQLNSIYEYSRGPWRTEYLDQYNRSDPGPVMNIEAGYENNSSLGVTREDLREEHYSFLLSGASGDTYGNEFVWPFDNSWMNWQSAAMSDGASDITHFAALVNSITWSDLTPDQDGTVFQGVGTPDDYCGAYTLDGTLALAYAPSTGTGSQTFTLNMSPFAATVSAEWYDPTAGTYESIGHFTNSGTHTFTSPATNDAGQNDFVLILKTP